MKRAIGLDFGTTNSTIAMATSEKDIRVARFEIDGKFTETFRSVLYFYHPHDPERGRNQVVAGPEAITRYLAADPKGRLLQSLKSFLGSRSFTSTSLYRSAYTIEDLIAIMIRQLKAAVERQFGQVGTTVVVGRPVRFSGAKNEDDDLFALDRLRKAIKAGGFDQIHFEYEPIAAAYSYEQQLDHQQLVLIADFGGGTSDFSLLRLGPSLKGDPSSRRKILGTAGVAIGGNDFDSAIVRQLVSPRLGLNSQYKSHGKLLPTPISIYKEFERWHYLSFLKNQKTIKMLESIKANALEADKIENLIHIIEYDLGFQLYRAVERTKLNLSSQQNSTFVFEGLPADIICNVTRSDFEDWINNYIVEIDRTVDRLLLNCEVETKDIDSVFLTGGSSFVPVVRRIFENKFGASRLRSGKELTSIGEGLSLKALELASQ